MNIEIKNGTDSVKVIDNEKKKQEKGKQIKTSKALNSNIEETDKKYFT